MTQWYVKDLSKITHISVQTLHHYDRIGLLKPSVRQANGYRLYSETDLSKLQRIIALKFFGFELSQIKKLLSDDLNIMEQLSQQAEFLKEKANALREASHILNEITAVDADDKSIPWQTMIKSIEVYQMTQQLEKTWAGKILNEKELKDFANFEKSIKERFSEDELNAISKAWTNLVKEVQNNLHKDPTSEFGIAFGKKCMDWVNHYYGNNIALRNALWEKGFKMGKAVEGETISPEIIDWMDKSMEYYYRDRITKIFEQIKANPKNIPLKAWNEVLEDMYGSDQEEKNGLMRMVIEDPATSPVIRDWLKSQIVK